MSIGEEKESQQEPKGFAGLSSLVSDVDTSLPPPAKKEVASSAESTSAERRTASESRSEPQFKPQQYRAPSQPPSGSFAAKWVLGIVAVVGVLWFIEEAYNPSSPAPSSATPARSTAPTSSAAPAQTRSPSRPEEVKPPVGRNHTLSTAQIRYCLAEDIRMNTAAIVINNHNRSDVDRFNAMVSDYNSRCGSFRYRRGALERARRDVEPYRSQIRAEGVSRFAVRPSAGSQSTPTPTHHASDATVRAVQQRLNELGYNAGPVDGLMGPRTQAAITAFQRDRGLAATGIVDPALVSRLQRAAERSGQLD